MIILRQLPYIDMLSLNDMMSFDTKVNIIEHCKLARIDIPKSWRKAQIADALADIFTKDPLWTLEVLPEEELELLKKLLSSSTEECIKYPKNEAKYLLMQKIFLRFHHIPSEDLAKLVLANKKKSGLLHFEELEKMAQEIAEELLMDLMKFTMGV